METDGMQVFLDRSKATEFLATIGIKTSEQGLADRVRAGNGPRYCVINGRALYLESDLLAWVQEQAARPVMRRPRLKPSQTAPAATERRTA